MQEILNHYDEMSKCISKVIKFNKILNNIKFRSSTND